MKEIGKKFRFAIALIATLLLLGLGVLFLALPNKTPTQVAQQTAQQTELNIPPPEQVGELILVQEGDNAPVGKEAYLTINQWNELGVYGSHNALIQGLIEKAKNDSTAAEIWRQIQNDVLYGTADIFNVTLQLVTPDVTSKTTIKVVGGTPITTSEKQLTIADYVFKIEDPNAGSDYTWLGWYGIPSDNKITGNVTITAKYGYFVNAPTVSPLTFEYTGGSQGPTITGYDENKMTRSGTVTATAVGNYKITFKLGNIYAWTGGSIADKTFTWTISPKSLTIPTLTGTYTYSGSEQTATLDNNFNSTTMSVSNNKRTNAGQQNITVALKDKTNYVWAGGTTADQTIEWTINRATVSTVPSQSNTLTYNGEQQSPTWNDYDTNKMSIQGTTAATDAGPHTAAFLIGRNYQWSDGSTGTKNVTWTIGKATATYTTEPTAIANVIEYTNNAIVNAGSSAYGTVHYKVGSGSYSDTVPKAQSLEAGNYTVYYKIVATNTNYKDSEESSLQVTIKPDTIQFSATVEITGDAKTYGTLTANVTGANATYTLKWYQNDSNSTTGGTAISEANSNTLYLLPAQNGKYIYVVATTNQTGYTGAVTSDQTAKIEKNVIAAMGTYLANTSTDQDKSPHVVASDKDGGTQAVMYDAWKGYKWVWFGPESNHNGGDPNYNDHLTPYDDDSVRWIVVDAPKKDTQWHPDKNEGATPAPSCFVDYDSLVGQGQLAILCEKGWGDNRYATGSWETVEGWVPGRVSNTHWYWTGWTDYLLSGISVGNIQMDMTFESLEGQLGVGVVSPENAPKNYAGSILRWLGTFRDPLTGDREYCWAIHGIQSAYWLNDGLPPFMTVNAVFDSNCDPIIFMFELECGSTGGSNNYGGWCVCNSYNPSRNHLEGDWGGQGCRMRPLAIIDI